ncbi:MAG: ribosomal protein S18-alanine N-acetyltransferase [Clostridia bacterium]
MNNKDINIEEIKNSDIVYLKEIDSKLSTPLLNNIYNEILNPIYTFYIARYKSIIVGYIVITTVIDTMDIVNITVKKEYQNNGIGTKLINFIINIAKEKQVIKILLEVRKNNNIAQKLYEKCNFKIIGIRNKYYSTPPDDALIYIKYL